MRKEYLLILIAFMLGLKNQPIFSQAAYDTVSIYDIQFVTDPLNNDLSPHLGDTVVVQGLVMTNPRDLWVGDRWAVFIADPDSFPNPWSGFFIIQHDTSQAGTLFGEINDGMICNFTGVVTEFEHFTELEVLTNPLVPIEILSTGNLLPFPALVTADKINNRGNAEPWESMWTRVINATIVNNQFPGNWAAFTDATGETALMAEFFNWFHDRFPSNYSWPGNGTYLNINGFMRDEIGGFTINPRHPGDLSVNANVFYPLNIGDLWQYWDILNSELLTRKVIKDTTFSNGLTYAVFTDQLFPYITYQRVSGDSIYRYHVEDNQDELFYDFSRSPGDIVSSIPHQFDFTDIYLTWTGTNNVFGVPRRQWSYTIDLYRQIFDDEQYHQVVDSIGLTSSSSFLGEFQLQGAIINGVEYGTITGLNGEDTNRLMQFTLFQNYPNPFNSSTTVKFTLPQSKYTTLKIYNVLGEIVAELVRETLPPGSYRFNWDSATLASGIYYYQLTSGNYSQTRKMLLIK